MNRDIEGAVCRQESGKIKDRVGRVGNGRGTQGTINVYSIKECKMFNPLHFHFHQRLPEISISSYKPL